MSFANEVKDFLAGYQMVTEMGEKKKQREQDKAYNDAVLELRKQELELDKQKMELDRAADAARARVGSSPSPSEVRAQTRFEWEAEDRRKKKEAEEADAAANAALSAIDPSTFDLGEVPVEEPQYAEGGLVDDEKTGALPVEDMRAPVRPKPRPADLAPAALPTTVPAPAATPAPVAEEPALPPAKSTRIVVERAAEVGKDVLDAVEYDLKTPKSAVGDGSDKLGVDWVTGEGAMTPDEISALEQKIDPQGTVAPHVKTAMTMAEVHRHFVEKGEPEKALRASVGYLTGIKGMTQALGALSMEAAQAGDPEAACRLANDACNRFPSEHIVNFTPDPKFGFTYSVKDAEGKVVEQGRMNPNQFLEVTGQIANGQAFTQQMFQFVSRHQKSGGDFGRALSGVEEAAARLAGVEAHFNPMGTMAEGEEGYEEYMNARKGAVAALQEAEASARELGNMSRDPSKRRDTGDVTNLENALRTARKSGMEMAIPYEPPAEPAATEAAPEESGGVMSAIGNFFRGASQVPQQPATEPVTPQGNQPAKPKTKAEYDALPSGTRFVAPDGSVRIKP